MLSAFSVVNHLELKPVLGLELTATPMIETPRGALLFKNVIDSYPLGAAMADGFVKEPAVVTRKNFNPAGMSAEEIERLKLEDGVRLHESVKVELETYARQSGAAIVKPFLLVIIYYKLGAEPREYQPDFVAETGAMIYMLESKARDALGDPEVLAKRDAAVTWCQMASDHAASYGGKPWRYALIPHDMMAENMTLAGLVRQFAA